MVPETRTKTCCYTVCRPGLRAKDYPGHSLRTPPSALHRYTVRAPRGLQASASECLLPMPVRSFVRLCGTFLRSPLLRLVRMRK